MPEACAPVECGPTFAMLTATKCENPCPPSVVGNLDVVTLSAEQQSGSSQAAVMAAARAEARAAARAAWE